MDRTRGVFEVLSEALGHHQNFAKKVDVRGFAWTRQNTEQTYLDECTVTCMIVQNQCYVPAVINELIQNTLRLLVYSTLSKQLTIAILKIALIRHQKIKTHKNWSHRVKTTQSTFCSRIWRIKSGFILFCTIWTWYLGQRSGFVLYSSNGL